MKYNQPKNPLGGLPVIKVALLFFLITSMIGCGRNTSREDFPVDDHCNTTDQAPIGPYYISGTPETTFLNYQNQPGFTMTISGVVYDIDENPIASAQIEVWHADSSGTYQPGGNGDASEYDPEQLNLRGTFTTDASGRYQLTSIQPGLLGTRRRHIYWRIVAPGSKTLVTQTYWLSERLDERDLNATEDKPTEICRYLDFQVSGEGVLSATFDIYLEAE
ncbi:hypothetical protein [Pontibacter sp. G13]|uniref:dioxygenase family protein n=1 Tax=Pontibacter sp. G13 TaxID=3074898 RepID=UPI00288A2473|nr:hypothetical protein [Pontibacter sp. G13]WNJ17318.1 hypothetical protein RJD25_20910 [Pontibacter sp. G13]